MSGPSLTSAPALDTNVLLRHLLQDSPQSAAASALIDRIERGELSVAVHETVLYETAFVLQRVGRRPRMEVPSILAGFIELSGVRLENKARSSTALDLYARLNISLADAYIAAAALESAEPRVISFDRDFDRVPGLTRVEP